MCRALRVLCAAPDLERLSALKRAAISASWELVGGAASVDELRVQLEDWRPDVVVLDPALGGEAITVARIAGRPVRVVGVGDLAGADATAVSLDGVRDAILGLPGPGGPVRS